MSTQFNIDDALNSEVMKSIPYAKWFQMHTSCCLGCAFRHIGVSNQGLYLNMDEYKQDIREKTGLLVNDVNDGRRGRDSCLLCLGTMSVTAKDDGNLHESVTKALKESGHEEVSGFRFGLRLSPSLCGSRDFAALSLIEKVMTNSSSSSFSSLASDSKGQGSSIDVDILEFISSRQQYDNYTSSSSQADSTLAGGSSTVANTAGIVFKPYKLFSQVFPLKEVLKSKLSLSVLPEVSQLPRLVSVFDGSQENVSVQDMKGVDMLLTICEEDAETCLASSTSSATMASASGSTGNKRDLMILNMENHPTTSSHQYKQDKKRKWGNKSDNSFDSSSPIITGESLLKHCLQFSQVGRSKLVDWMLFPNQVMNRTEVENSTLLTTATTPDFSGYLIKWQVEISRAPIYLGGRYLKLARDVPQSKWIIENEGRKGRYSVSELIIEQVATVFKVNFDVNDEFVLDSNSPNDGYVKFHAAGREDIDVRMLGRGRPFILEVINPKVIPFSSELYQPMPQLQDKVNEWSGLNTSGDVQVEALQHVPRRIFDEIIEGEGEKKKTYRCVVWVSEPVTAAMLQEKLGSVKDLMVDQDTPLRVLHRRTPLVRVKVIHSLEATLISNQWFTLDIVASAGTYIKEFVHGDLGRTSPSVADLLEVRTVDILQLDVLAVHTSGLLA